MEPAYLLPVALLPVAAMLFYIYKSETFEKEPPRILVTLFLLGAASVVPIIFVENAINKDIELDLYTGAIKDQYALAFRMAFICAAMTEESFKYIFMLSYTWRKKEFNYKFDGIVYAAFTSMGFAAIENVAYLFRLEDTSVIFLRAVTSIPGHLMFSVFMGYFYGRARYAKSMGNSGACFGNLCLSLLSAILLHGFYDFCLMTGDERFVTVFYVFIITMDIITIILVHKSAKRNQAIFQAIPVYTGVYRPVMNSGAIALSPAGYGMNMNRPFRASDMRPVAGPRTPGQGMNNQSRFAPQNMAGQGMNRQGMNNQSRFAPQNMAGQGMNGQGMNNQSRFAPQNMAGQGMNRQGMNNQSRFAPQNMAGQNMNGRPMQQPRGTGSFYIEPSQDEEKTVGLFNVDNGQDMAEEATVSLFRLEEQSARNEFQTIGTIGRQQHRFISCPLCGTVNLFDAFHCKSCGASLHIGF